MDAAPPALGGDLEGGTAAPADFSGHGGALDCCRMDPVFRLLVGRWGLGEQGLAVLTAALGFGVLTAWYLADLAVDPAARGRRGPFEYFTATAGDLVLLPLLNGVAVRYAREVMGGLLWVVSCAGRHTRRLLAPIERAYNSPLGLAFVLVVVATAAALQHLDELYGVDRNWTVPERGDLRPVAIYHQVFFACEAFIVAFLVVRHAVTVRCLLRLAREGPLRARLTAVAERSLSLFGWVLLGWGIFVSLRMMDFFYLTPTASAGALAELPAPVTTLVVYYVLALVTGILPAVAVRRRYGLGWTAGPVFSLGASLTAPIAGPAAWILVARLLTA